MRLPKEAADQKATDLSTPGELPWDPSGRRAGSRLKELGMSALEPPVSCHLSKESIVIVHTFT